MTEVLAAIGLATAIVTLLTALIVLKSIRAVHAEVKTTNGRSLGVLADNAEGRRILDTVAPDDRTVSDLHYTEVLKENEAKP